MAASMSPKDLLRQIYYNTSTHDWVINDWGARTYLSISSNTLKWHELLIHHIPGHLWHSTSTVTGPYRDIHIIRPMDTQSYQWGGSVGFHPHTVPSRQGVTWPLPLESLTGKEQIPRTPSSLYRWEHEIYRRPWTRNRCVGGKDC